MRYRPSAPKVIFEAFEDETIAIHFDSGRYYSMSATAHDIWSMLVAGYDSQAISERMAAQHGLPHEVAQAALTDFLNQLTAAELITEAPDAQPAAPSYNLKAAAFVKPVLEQHDDMQELLLLDPIHEVDEAGWPKRAH
jgi:Coenzyme PQQ synthesis protein D (PqqD)